MNDERQAEQHPEDYGPDARFYKVIRELNERIATLEAGRSKSNPKRIHTRRRFYGLTDEQQQGVYQRQRDAIMSMFDAMQEYCTAELEAKLEALDAKIREEAEGEEPTSVDAEFAPEGGE